jgi:hypothetical protein
VPAHVPPVPPLMGPTAQKRLKALQQSKSALMRHAAISTVVALFLIGFNVAFTKGFNWFPWPVAALIVLWLYHLHRYLEQSRGVRQGFNAWLDDGSNILGDARLPIAGEGQEEMQGLEAEQAHRQAALDFGKSKQRRGRDWLH